MTLKGDSGAVPAVLYAATSTEDKRGSIPTQLKDGRALAAREGWRVVAEHRDEAASAYKGNRGAGLAAAKRDAERLAAECGESVLIVQHSDRLARGDGVRADHLVELALWARKTDVRITSVQDPATFEGGLAFAAMMGDRNHEDSRRKASAVRDGVRRAFERGQLPGGPTPDGLSRVPRVAEDGRVVSDVAIDPTRGPLIRRIFELAAAGVADANIARALNRDGHRTASGKAWFRRRVQDTVTNPVYAGLVVWHRGQPDEERRVGEHPALVDPETFERIQKLRAARDRGAGSDRLPKGRPNSRHLLAGLATCERCGDLMRPTVSTYKRKDGTHARHYECRHVKDGTGLCDAPKVDAEVVDAAFASHLESFFIDFEAWAAAMGAQRETDRTAVEQSVQWESEALREVDRLRNALAHRYAHSLGAGDDAQAEACAQAMRLKATERDQIAHRLERLRETLAAIEEEEAAPVDAMLDFYNRLSDGIRGRLARDEIADVNRGLREVLLRVDLEMAPDGQQLVQVCPVLRPEVVEFFSEPAAMISRVMEEEGPAPHVPAILDTSGPSPIVPPVHRLVAARPEQKGRNGQAYRCTKWNRFAFAASQPYADGGPRSSSVPRRWSDVPGRATHFGSGWSANSWACSASLRQAVAMDRITPVSALAAEAIRSNAAATSGRIGLPCR